MFLPGNSVAIINQYSNSGKVSRYYSYLEMQHMPDHDPVYIWDFQPPTAGVPHK